VKAFYVTFSALVLLISTPFVAYATWDGTFTGKIFQIHVTGAENYGFRVVLEGRPALCGNNNNWAYVNKSNSNYETYVSVLLSAKLAGSPVKIQSNQSTNGYCEIGYLPVY